jgi:Ca-activated chloride channel family protein
MLLRKDGTMERVPPDIDTLQDIARTTGGRFFAAPTERDLEVVYANLGRGLAKREEKQEVTAAFAGGALALLLAGMVVSLLRTGRVP